MYPWSRESEYRVPPDAAAFVAVAASPPLSSSATDETDDGCRCGDGFTATVMTWRKREAR